MMIDLSEEVHEVLTNIKQLAKENDGLFNRQKIILDSADVNGRELIDVSNINFDNDETWLYEPFQCISTVKNLKEWLYQDVDAIKDIEFHSNRLSLIRELTKFEPGSGIDSRTYTRPKKRFNRPSIENYNNNYFKMNLDDNKYHEEEVTKETAPLKFDYTEPCAFNNILTSASDAESFQNMSPPSLVTSLCSSTFANLMENSYIQNDPVLREIRDTDLTDAMLQDCEPPMFKSLLTDSCTSISSDTPEGFLKKSMDTTFKKIYRKTVDKENILNESGDLNSTYLKDSSSDICFNGEGNITQIISPPKPLKSSLDNTVINGTYRKSTKLNTTYEKSPLNDDPNRTITIVDSTNRLNRHSYIIDNRTLDTDVSIKRNSFAYSAGSCDSLDYVSSLSNSSKGSNKMLNMAEVDALVLQQEQSLQQVMSTPKPNKVSNKLWDNNVSPISSLDKINGLSDSESSNDDFLTVGSSGSNMTTPYESETQLNNSNHSLDKASVASAPIKLSNIAGSYSNLKTVGAGLKGSYTNLKTGLRGSYSNIAQARGASNLYTMKSNLKASYTQLKPVLANLPQTDVSAKSMPNFKQPTAARKEQIPTKGPLKSVPTLKMQPPKMSGLPRPVSSIPRPSSSRIPAPKSESRISTYRHMSRPVSKVDIDDDF